MTYALHCPRSSPPRAERILLLAETAFRGQRRRFGLLPGDRLRHVYIVGKTGCGKSTLLSNLIAQDLASGEGLAVLDPHGDLAAEALRAVPQERGRQVLLFEPADADHPVSFNVLRQGRKRHENVGLLASQLISVFRSQWSDFWGPRLEHILRNAILAVAPDPRASLLFLYRFLTDEQVRSSVVSAIQDPAVRQFWTAEFAGYTKSLQAEATAPVLNKLGAFIASPVVRNIVGHVRSRVDIGALMERRGVLIADLSTGKIGDDASRLLGGLLLASIQLASAARPRGGAPFFVYVDEFQRFVNDSLATLLAESRKFGVGLTLAHQYLGQLPEGLRDAVLGNAGSLIVFRLGAVDARVMAGEVGPPFSAEDLQGLGTYKIAARLLARGEQLRAVAGTTLPPSKTPVRCALPEEVRAASRARYCQSRAKVESGITAAFTG